MKRATVSSRKKHHNMFFFSHERVREGLPACQNSSKQRRGGSSAFCSSTQKVSNQTQDTHAAKHEPTPPRIWACIVWQGSWGRVGLAAARANPLLVFEGSRTVSLVCVEDCYCTYKKACKRRSRVCWQGGQRQEGRRRCCCCGKVVQLAAVSSQAEHRTGLAVARLNEMQKRMLCFLLLSSWRLSRAFSRLQGGGGEQESSVLLSSSSRRYTHRKLIGGTAHQRHNGDNGDSAPLSEAAYFIRFVEQGGGSGNMITATRAAALLQCCPEVEILHVYNQIQSIAVCNVSLADLAVILDDSDVEYVEPVSCCSTSTRALLQYEYFLLRDF